MLRLALATAIPACGLDEDMPLLLDALRRHGIDAQTLAWDDATVSWRRFDAVLLRSTWNYMQQLAVFLDWCARIERDSRLLNPLAVVRWNTDKRYLAQLREQGLPVVDSWYLAPGDDPASLPELDEFVVKPTVGAGSRDARRFPAEERALAVAHARALLDRDRHVLVQPYLHQVDENGETALVYFDGVFSHAIRKGPLLRRGTDATRALFGAEHIQARRPSNAEREVAEQVLAAQPFGKLLYARVDLLPGEDGPRLLELELTEPSLFLGHDVRAAERLAAALRSQVEAIATGESAEA